MRHPSFRHLSKPHVKIDLKQKKYNRKNKTQEGYNSEKLPNSSRIFIVGGGPSLRGFDFSQLSKELTISVNASIFDLPKCNYFITMDHSFLRKIKLHSKEFRTVACSKVFVAGMHHTYLKEINGAFVDTRFRLTYDLSDFDVIIKSRSPDGCGFDWSDFRNGQNSGHCALQLSVLLGYKEVYLLGFDMQSNNNLTHYHNRYVGQPNFDDLLVTYRKYMKTALDRIKKDTDIRVVSCAPESSLNEWIDYVSVEEVLK
jgi:hypothetical protein